MNVEPPKGLAVKNAGAPGPGTPGPGRRAGGSRPVEGGVTPARAPSPRPAAVKGRAADRFSRPPWERMLRIHQAIRSGRRPSGPRLAADLEVSPTTIKRDIEFMRDRLGLPLQYESRRHGFFYSLPVDNFPLTGLTEAEGLALLVARKALEPYDGTSFARSLGTAFRKLTLEGPASETPRSGRLESALSFRPFAPESPCLPGFSRVLAALRQHRALRFLYRNLGAREPRLRLVHPYHLACVENHWYLFAFDTGRRAVRTFALARLSAPRLLSQRFVPPADFHPDAYLRGSFSVLKGDADYEVVIEFDAWATDLARGRRWHPSQSFTELPGAGSRLRLRLSTLEEVERWVLSWGAHATVIRPRVLARRLSDTAARLAERYLNA